MTVRELIEILSELDEDATVLVALQESFPFESEIAGVALRANVEEHEDHDEPQHKGTSPNDVLLVEGTQLRYGSKAAWAVARS